MRLKKAVLIFSISTTTKWSLFTFWLQGCTLQSTIVIGYLSKPDYGATNDLELDVPSCAFQYRHLNEELGFLCLDDNEYPLYDIENSLFYHHHSVYQMYKDVHNINTQNSVANITTLRDETYLCPSTVKYVKPVRAINSKGEWRIVLNHLRSKDDFISQTIRVELCVDPGQPCPKVPGNPWFLNCSSKYSPSMKSVIWASPCRSAVLCTSKRWRWTVRSIFKVCSTACKAEFKNS